MVESTTKPTNERKTILKISVHNIALNGLLAVFKFVIGLVAHSTIMVSEAIHTASDMVSTVVVMVGMLIARSDSDGEVSSFRKNLENYVAMALAVILFSGGAGIGWNAISKIRLGVAGELSPPGAVALIASVVSIIVKEWMYQYSKRVAIKIDSDALMADAWHHRTDALSYVASFVGIIGARLGFPILDPVAGIIICLFIIRSAVIIFINAVKKIKGIAVDDSHHHHH